MNNDLIHINTLPPFKRMCVTIGNLPTSFMESMTYYEALEWLYNYLDTTVIPAINLEGEAITELQTAFTTLKNYVDNYFDNLDVQTEINNKLDDMAESGQLTDIIAQYLGLAGIIAFDNVASMKLAENLVNGSKVRTMGYYSVNDGGSSLYKIRTITNEDVVDEATIIALADNTLIAELIIENHTLKFNQIGGKGNDQTFDNSSILLKAINLINDNKIKLLFTDKDYYFATPINSVYLRYCELSSNIYSTLNYTGTGYFITFTYTNNVLINNLNFKGNEENNCINFGDTNSYRTYLNNIQTSDFVKTLYIGRPAYFYISESNFYAKTTNETLIEIGNSSTKQASELLFIDNCIFAGGESLTATGDFIRINQVSTLRITNTDFANTLGRWIYFNTESTGDLWDIQVNGCTFTRAKYGIVFDLKTAVYPNNIIFDKPLFSEHGNWSDGEEKIINVNRTGTGTLQNCIFRDVTVTRINNTYPSEYIFYSPNSAEVFINIIRKPNVNDKYKTYNANGLFQNYTLTPGEDITLSSCVCSKNKINNLVSLSGSLSKADSNISAYATLISGVENPKNLTNVSFIGTDNNGNIYPLFIENNILKCRKSIPASTSVRLGFTYESN